MPSPSIPGDNPDDLPFIHPDTQRLHELGYAQELNRGMGTFSNFAISFSIISILAGAITTFFLGLNAGGPRVIMIGWVVVGFFSLCVGMSMAEICSAYPTAGGLYYWSAKLAKKSGAFWSFLTGWFNLIGGVGVVASVDFALATMTAYFINTFTKSIDPTKIAHVFTIYLIVLVVHGLLNTFGVTVVRLLGDISVWWHIVGVGIIFGILFIAPNNTEGLSFLSEGANRTGWSGGFTTIYVSLLGLLLAQYTITGFDASAHVSEETIGASVSAPKAIVRSIYISTIAAFVLNLAMLAAFPKGALGTLGANMTTSGTSAYDAIAAGGINAGANLFMTIGKNLGRTLIFISIVGQFFCGMASVTANSRMIYAFSRDGALPGSKIWHQVNHKTRTPTNSVWLSVVASALIGSLALVQVGGNAVAFFALTGIAVVGLYVAYIIPVFLRLRSDDFQPGPWNLGSRSKIVGWIAVAWVAFITILFFLPVYWPFWPIGGSAKNPDGTVMFYYINNVNFTGPIIIGAVILIGLYWQLSAKKWFTGPKVMGTPEELAAIEHELSELT